MNGFTAYFIQEGFFMVKSFRFKKVIAFCMALAFGAFTFSDAAIVKAYSSDICTYTDDSKVLCRDDGFEETDISVGARSGIDTEAAVWEVLDYVNSEREKNGLPALVMDAELVDTANLRATEIVNKFSHTRPNGTDCFTAFPSMNAMGENIAAGQRSAYEVMYDTSYGWMNSAGHRSNILSSSFNCVGIACYYDPNSYYGYHWVQCFGYKSKPNILSRDSQSSQNSGEQQGTDRAAHPYIKGECQMPYTGEGGGYLIGVETYDNPNQSYQYEMLILDCTLLAQGLPAWTYTTGKCGVAEGNALWTIWQPQYGYYWTLFRVYDASGNMLDEVCYGFVNAY